jgi:hypothetical protein
MALTPPPPAVQASDSPTVFDQKAYARVQWEAQNVTELNALQEDVGFKYNYVAAAYQAAGGIGAAMSTAAAAAQQAQTNADRAIAAWGAATAPAETLAALQANHIGPVIKTLIADTSKDSAEWRKRCQHTSWYNRTLGGDRWIAPQATVAAAWAAAGNATGAVFMASATAGPIVAGRFYTATSASAATEVFDGVSRGFPALFQAVGEAQRIVVYDLTAPGCPMFMVVTPANAPTLLYTFWRGARNLTSLAYSEGVLYFGTNTVSDTGLCFISFVGDNIGRIGSATANGGTGLRVVDRNLPIDLPQRNTLAIVNSVVNDVAATVLPDAPIDPATGLLVPTIAAFTAGGVSVIKHDGAVASITGNSPISGQPEVTLGGFAGNKIVAGYGGVKNLSVYNIPATSTTTAAAIENYGGSFGLPIPTPPNTSNKALATLGESSYGLAHSAGLALIKANPSAHQAGMVATITNTVPGAWQEGDPRGAWFISSEAETVGPSTELVPNGTFATDASGWTGVGCSLSAVGGVLRVTQTQASGNVYAYCSYPTVIGKTYQLSGAVATKIAGQSIFLYARDAYAAGSNMGQIGLFDATGPIPAGSFVATASTTLIVSQQTSLTSGQFYELDSISCKQVEPDRSVKGKGLSIVGALTKTLVGGVAMYSGWGPTNYAEIASADQDYGTGDFHYMWWEAPYDATNQTRRITRGIIGGAQSLSVYTGGAYTYSVLTPGSAASTGVPQVAGLAFCVLQRVSGVLQLWINGVMRWSAANSENFTQVGATLRVGTDVGATPAWVGTPMNYLRTSATALSADDIAKIYRDELQLFQPGAVGTLAGPSSAVTAISYDDVTDITCVMTGTHRNDMKGLMRVGSEALTVGTGTSVSAQGGVISTGGSTGARVYMPALTLRDELKRKDEARRALGRTPWVIQFDAIAGQTVFPLPKGTRPLAVYLEGVLKRVGATKWYTVLDDGYQESVKAAVAPGAAAQVDVLVVRK